MLTEKQARYSLWSAAEALTPEDKKISGLKTREPNVNHCPWVPAGGHE